MQLQTILLTVCATTAVQRELVLGRSRKEKVVTARFLFFYLSKKHTKFSADDISKFVNRKDKTYFHAIKKVGYWRIYDKNFNALYETINHQISLLKS